MNFKRIFLIICFLPFVSAEIVIDVRTPVEWSEGHLLLIDAGYTNVTNAGSMSQAGDLLDLKIVKK